MEQIISRSPAANARMIVMEMLCHTHEVALQGVNTLPIAVAGKPPQIAEGAGQPDRVFQPPPAVPLVQLGYELLMPASNRSRSLATL